MIEYNYLNINVFVEIRKEEGIIIETLTIKKQLYSKFRINNYICIAKAGLI